MNNPYHFTYPIVQDGRRREKDDSYIGNEFVMSPLAVTVHSIYLRHRISDIYKYHIRVASFPVDSPMLVDIHTPIQKLQKFSFPQVFLQSLSGDKCSRRHLIPSILPYRAAEFHNLTSLFVVCVIVILDRHNDVVSAQFCMFQR